ncbi:paraquat-inducible protein A [Shewanella dokdonensis]|uniref:Paraquat-inducible protein A n=2 Tax=Shewanella dokdonensis TaxID=712036 RepID=A0ABX8DI54_9GAMM|nr:paraquat-inducible protein A [Shewanella dokdonensis]MCL1076160.1 paraquat-inducible protein A [Shewanella dokdonensis]QVK24454.1 paraquat-inducible protein A [Shewanella dokdonensis]
MSNWKAVLLLLLSLALLVPGVTLPILTIDGHVEKAKLSATGMDMIAESVSKDSADGKQQARSMLGMVAGLLGLDHLQGEVEVFHKSRSIWGTVTELQQHGNLLVAVLVALFSVVIPALKLLLLLISVLLPLQPGARRNLAAVTNAIAKWSMADVFVVALIISFLAGDASAGMGDLVRTSANFELGFWCFLSYCLLAIAGQFLLKPRQDTVS